VVGEVILHTDHVYVCLTTSAFSGEPARFYFRTCKGCQDYAGGGNNWYSFRRLADDPDEFVNTFKRLAAVGQHRR
jgi:hypothetical protein